MLVQILLSIVFERCVSTNMFTPEQVTQIKQIIAEQFQKNYGSGVPRVPPHTHNGIDNLPVLAVNSLTAGSGITITPAGSTTGNLTISSSGGGGSPGGPVNSIQFNNPLGTFAGDASLTFVTADAFYGGARMIFTNDAWPSVISGAGDNANLIIITNGAQDFDSGNFTGSITLQTGDVDPGAGGTFQAAGEIIIASGNSYGTNAANNSFGGDITIRSGVTSGTGNMGGSVKISSGATSTSGEANSVDGSVYISALHSDGVGSSQPGVVALSPNVVLFDFDLSLDPVDQSLSIDIDATGSINVLWIKEGTPPGTADMDGKGYGAIYVEAGELKYRGSAGTVTTLATA